MQLVFVGTINKAFEDIDLTSLLVDDSVADKGATHHSTALHLPQTTEFGTCHLFVGELYASIEQTIVLLGAGVGAFELSRYIGLEYGVSLDDQSI